MRPFSKKTADPMEKQLTKEERRHLDEVPSAVPRHARVRLIIERRGMTI